MQRNKRFFRDIVTTEGRRQPLRPGWMNSAPLRTPGRQKYLWISVLQRSKKAFATPLQRLCKSLFWGDFRLSFPRNLSSNVFIGERESSHGRLVTSITPPLRGSRQIKGAARGFSVGGDGRSASRGRGRGLMAGKGLESTAGSDKLESAPARSCTGVVIGGSGFPSLETPSRSRFPAPEGFPSKPVSQPQAVM